MTERHKFAIDFMVRLRKIDNARITVRDVIILYAIGRNPGVMGRELSHKLGYPSRSSVQDNVARLIRKGYIEDRRPRQDKKTPNDLYITQEGEAFLADILPA